MRTPAGTECSFFYGDYFRGRDLEECRLIGNVPAPKNWSPDLCQKCPVPAIQRANACENMILHGEVKPGFLRMHRQVTVSAYCKKSQLNVKEPEIGCPLCHDLGVLIHDSTK
jgi:hypothetical protein